MQVVSSTIGATTCSIRPDEVVAESAWGTSCSPAKGVNEDHVLADPACGLFAVADGMGGHPAGELASRLAIQALASFAGKRLRHGRAYRIWSPGDEAPTSTLLSSAFQAAQTTLVEHGRRFPERDGMRTSLLALIFPDARTFAIGHVGNSRAYLLRGGVVEQLTRDHTLVEAFVERGLVSRENQNRSFFRKVVTRAIGHPDRVAVEIDAGVFRPGDVLVVCTAGVSYYLDEADLLGALQPAPLSLDVVCRRLIAVARERGSRADASVVAVRCA